MTCASLQDFILANPNNHSGLKIADYEKFLTSLMSNGSGEPAFPVGTCMIELASDPQVTYDDEGDIIENLMDVEELANYATDSTNLAGFGMKFLVDTRKEIFLGNQNIVEDIFKSIISISRRQVEIPQRPEKVEENQEEGALNEMNESQELKIENLQRQLDDLKEKVGVRFRTSEEN